MKQIFQDVANGQTIVRSVPRPQCKPDHVLIRVACSLISAGTERTLVDFGRSGYLAKARQQPEKVRMVLDKIRTDGLVPTVEAVRAKLDQPIAVGYSAVGVVIEVGSGVQGLSVGDRVVSNGKHAEIVCVPTNLCARIPAEVSDRQAAFAVVAAIALQGVRLATPTLGESFVVIGLGLIGLLTVQILRAHGCRVLGIDYDASKLELARSFGAATLNPDTRADIVQEAKALSNGNGVDGVLITASSSSNEPLHQAAQMCRKRGRIVLVGVIGSELRRADFYEKELSFQVSCSYGPGRYDPQYEQQGVDYPIGFVRWTAQRNFEAVLELLARRGLDTDRLVSASFDVDRADAAYQYLVEQRGALGIVLDYPNADRNEEHEGRVVIIDRTTPDRRPSEVKAVLGVIGAGNYCGRVLLPAFAASGATLKTIASSSGVSSDYYGRKFGFAVNTTDVDRIFADDEIDSIVIATQHDSHAELTIRALEAGKNVFVEKPLALALEQLRAIESAYSVARSTNPALILMVGFNRRFAPLVRTLKAAIERSSAPISIVYLCNAGSVPDDSWVNDARKGGGRIVGEACHFIDLARYLANSRLGSAQATGSRARVGRVRTTDAASFTLDFENGSIATVHYFTNGHRSFSKERIQVFQQGQVFELDNFRRLRSYGAVGVSKRAWRQDKGQAACCKSFIDAVRSRATAPIPFAELLEVSRVSIEVQAQIQTA